MIMKQFRILTFIATIATLGIFMSCGDDDGGTIDLTSDLAVTFNGTSAMIQEGTTGTVTVSFPAAPVAATVSIAVSGTATYTDDYTTTPAVTDGTIELSIAEGATSATVSFDIVNDESADDDETVILTLTATEGIELGDNTTYTVTITEEEVVVETTTIASLRDLFNPDNKDIDISGSNTAIADGTIIRGVVTSVAEANNDQNIFIQDASGAIQVRFSEPHSFVQGDELQIDISTAALSDFFDLVQISGNVFGDSDNIYALPTASATKVGDGTLPTPEVITLDQLNSGDFEAKLVKVESVSFSGADGNATFEDGSFGQNEITDGTTTALTRVDAPFETDLLPLGTGDITGIPDVRNGEARLLPQTRADIFDNMPGGTLAFDESVEDFGDVDNGEESGPQSFKVIATDVSGSVTVSASANFQISLESEGGFSESVSVPNVTELTLYARFAPSTGVNGAVNGQITASADDVATVSFDVSGTETGNGAVGAPTDLFFSEYVEGSSNNKYLEIFNGTGSAIDLSDYELHRYGNGASEPVTYALAGTIADGAVIVIANNNADIFDGTTYDATDVNSATFYNGDDAVALFKVSTSSLIDIIGQIGCDPGSNWTDGDHSTAEKTLVRKPTVNAGVSQNPTSDCGPTSFTTMTTEWDVFDQNDVSDLGSHTFGN